MQVNAWLEKRVFMWFLINKKCIINKKKINNFSDIKTVRII
jgi:hypothetical protein